MKNVHPIELPIIEKRLLRAVVEEIEQIDNQYPGTVPHSVMKKYHEVVAFYNKQMADEEYLMTTFHPDVPDEIDF